MLLVNELQACGCNDSPEKFRERLINGLVAWFPGRTIDRLVCIPMDALEYCEKIRQDVGSQVLYDVVILKTLMNIRRRRDCPTGLNAGGSRQNVSQELVAAGCQLAADKFKELVVDCLADMYKSQTIDEMVCHPREAGALCNYVRLRSKCDNLTDGLILSTLMNVRKAGGQ